MSCCDFGGTRAIRSVAIDGITVEQDGILVGNFVVLNFAGNLHVTDEGDGSATISVVAQTFLPEQWARNNIQRNLANAVVVCQLSTNFSTFKVITSGSITAISTRLSQAVVAGTMTLAVTKNGVATALTITHTNALNTSGGIATLAAGTVTYVPGDLIGVFITTDGAFTPVAADVEAMIQVTE